MTVPILSRTRPSTRKVSNFLQILFVLFFWTINVPEMDARAEPSEVQQGSANSGVSDSPDTDGIEKDPKGTKFVSGSVGGDIIYLPNKEGVLVAVPYNSKYEEYIEWISKQDTLPIQKDYTISSVVIRGEEFRSENGKDYIAAEVEIRLTLHKTTWVQIPLEMGELIVGENVVHEGVGEFVFDRRDAVQGMIWWGKGSGRHRIQLKGYIPVRRDVTTRRLSLKVPKTLVNELNIVVRNNQVELVNAGEKGIQSVSQKGADSAIELKGEIERFDVSWRPVEKSNGKENFIESQATFFLSESSARFNLDVKQRLASLQGAIRAVDVRLPSQFEFIDVKGKELQSYHQDEANNLLKLVFNKPSAGPIELDWNFRSTGDSDASKLTIDGLDVQGTNLESGEILIAPSSERQLNPVNVNSEVILKKRPDGRTTPATYASAYRFLKQPFQLELSMSTLQPEYTLRPEYFLTVDDNLVSLETRINIQVLQGQLSGIKLHWPAIKQQPWTLDPFLMAALGAGFIQVDDEHYEIRLNKPVSGQQTIILKATCDRVAGKSVYDIDLPGFIHAASYPPIMAIGNPVTSRTTIVGNMDLVESLNSEQGVKRLNWIPDRERLRYQFFELRPSKHQATIRLKTDDYVRKVITRTYVSTIVDEDQIHVTQRISLDIDQEGLKELRLTVPQSTAIQFRLKNESDTELTSTVFELGNKRIADLDFRPALLGSKNILISYTIPRGELDADVKLPISTVSGHNFETVHLEVANGVKEEYSITVNSTKHPSWSVKLTSQSQQEYVLRGHTESIPAEILPISGTKLIVLEDDQLLISTRLTHGPQSYSTVRGVLIQPVTHLIVDLPNDATKVTALINDNEQVPVQMMNEAENRIRIDLESRKTNSSLPIQLTYQQSHAVNGRMFSQLQTTAPVILGTGNCELVWDVSLPAGENLLFSSADLLPQFDWKWHWFGWHRINYDKSVHAALGISETLSNGPRYSFRVQSSANSIHSVGFIRQSTLLLIGAGAGLFFGLLLIQCSAKIGILWTVYSLIAMVFVFAMFETSLIFFQPAGMGMFLSLIAFSINKRRGARRRRGKFSTISYSQSADSQEGSQSVWKPSDSQAVNRTDSTQTHAPVVPVPELQVEPSSH